MIEHEDAADSLQSGEQDKEITQLLANPEVKTSLTVVRSTIAERYAQLEQAGNKVIPMVEGVTDDGTCVTAARYGPKDKVIEYLVFTFDLHDVARPGFTETLEQRGIGKVDWDDIEVETPDDPMLVSWDDREAAGKSGLHKNDKAAFMALSDAYVDWRDRNTLHLPTHGSNDPIRYRGKVVRAFDDAALGETGRAMMEQELAPLKAQHQGEVRQWARADATNDETAMAKHDAARKELIDRWRRTIDIMYANPQIVRDKPEVVHDPVKAEYVAHEMKNSMDKAVKAKNESGRAKHEDEAERRADLASSEYRADPLGVTKKPEKRGLFGRFGRKS